MSFEKINDKQPIFINMSRGSFPTFSFDLGQRLIESSSEHKCINFRETEDILYTLEDLKNNNSISRVKLIVIDSFPPIFNKIHSKEMELISKYKINANGYNINDEGQTIEYAKGIARMLIGEYPELPIPVIIYDFGNKSYHDNINNCYVFCPSDMIGVRETFATVRQKLLKINNQRTNKK